MAPIETEPYLWLVVAGAIASFIMSFGIGANDVANSFATSVGSKISTAVVAAQGALGLHHRTLYLWQAVSIAAVFEFSGAVLVGASVTDTIKSGITDTKYFEDIPAVFMLGMFCALIGAGTWVLLATRLALPVSTTHSIIGAIIGFTVVVAGFSAVQWTEVGLIVLSWFLSPAVSGTLAATGYYLVRRFILRSPNSLARGFLFYPILVSITIAVNVFFIMYKGIPGLDLEDTIPYWQGVLIALAGAIVLAIVLNYTIVPYMRKQIELMPSSNAIASGSRTAASMTAIAAAGNYRSVNGANYHRINDHDDNEEDVEGASEGKGVQPSPSKLALYVKSQMAIMFDDDLHTGAEKSEAVKEMHDAAEVFDDKTEALFAFLQVVTATFMSFAHGANDVANAIAPFAAIYSTYTTAEVAEQAPVPIWILAMGGFGIVMGLMLYGYLVIRSIGLEMIKMTASRGFIIELAAASTVVTASILGLPISTTHCLVGATVSVGLLEGKNGFNRQLFLRTGLSWVVTIVFAALVSSAVFAFAYFSP